MDTSYVEQGSDGIDPSEHTLKVPMFRPLVNVKTRNFFAYSFAILTRNKSANSESSIHWVTGAPDHIQEKIEHVKSLHHNLDSLYSDMDFAAKDGDRGLLRSLKRKVSGLTTEIDEVCYPLDERRKVETAQSALLKLEKSNKVEVAISPTSIIPASIVDSSGPAPVKVTPGKQERAAATRKANKLKKIEAEEKAKAEAESTADDKFEMVEPD